MTYNRPASRVDNEPGAKPNKPSIFSRIGSVASGVRDAVFGNRGANSAHTVNFRNVQDIIDTTLQDRRMSDSKKILLLKNLRDQLGVNNNTFAIEQIKRGRVDYSKNQCFDPNIRSRYQRGFFSLNDATGTSAVVDFANDSFGGGVIGPEGFVQEEKMLLETNLLTEAGKYNNLTSSPLYIQALQTHAFVQDGLQLYGNKALRAANISQQNLHRFFTQTQPKKINIVAMAAVDMSGNRWREYQPSNLTTMFETALAGFQAHVAKGGKTIHTGAWGAGVFGNSENVTCVLQILAAQAAGAQLVYHGNEEAYNSAVRFLRGPHVAGKSYQTVIGSLCGYMQKRHHAKEFWSPKSPSTRD